MLLPDGADVVPPKGWIVLQSAGYRLLPENAEANHHGPGDVRNVLRPFSHHADPLLRSPFDKAWL